MTHGILREARLTPATPWPMQGFLSSAEKRIVDSATLATNWLPKAVLDRIHRYAGLGWEPRIRYGREACFLLAVAIGRLPIVVLRATREEFSELRSAALVEWKRSARMKS